jgi:hypothetical protein
MLSTLDLPPKARQRRLEKTVEIINLTQTRIARAERSARKRRLRELRAIGYNVSSLPTCDNTS